MNTRQRQILEAITGEYQKTGQPVASQILVEKYNFDLSPATIRSEMLELDKEGLLVQPYHSAGRVPTTKAYRQFVNQLLSEQKFHIKGEEKIKKNIPNFVEGKTLSSELAKTLAEFSHNLGFSGFLGRAVDFHDAGLSFLLEEEEFCQPKRMIDILRGFEALEREFAHFFNKLDHEVEVFIGEENPIDDFWNCSLVVSNYKTEEEKGFLGVLGPKRMDYERNIFLVEEIKKIIEKV